jgi:hypothetical protein
MRPKAEDLPNLLEYDPNSGKLFWKARVPGMFHSEARDDPDAMCRSWNTRYAGKEAFISIDENGYKRGKLFGVSCKAHRAVWAICTGEWPKGHIDHIDGDTGNNRIGNLRNVTRPENMKNMKLMKSNKSGVMGVSWSSRDKVWKAAIGVDNRKIHLGNYKEFDDAVMARMRAEKEYGFHPNHGRT